MEAGGESPCAQSIIGRDSYKTPSSSHSAPGTSLGEGNNATTYPAQEADEAMRGRHQPHLEATTDSAMLEHVSVRHVWTCCCPWASFIPGATRGSDSADIFLHSFQFIQKGGSGPDV